MTAVTVPKSWSSAYGVCLSLESVVKVGFRLLLASAVLRRVGCVCESRLELRLSGSFGFRMLVKFEE